MDIEKYLKHDAIVKTRCHNMLCQQLYGQESEAIDLTSSHT